MTQDKVLINDLCMTAMEAGRDLCMAANGIDLKPIAVSHHKKMKVLADQILDRLQHP